MAGFLVILVLLPFLVVATVGHLLWSTWCGRAMLAVLALGFLGFVVETLWRAVFPKRKPPARK